MSPHELFFWNGSRLAGQIGWNSAQPIWDILSSISDSKTLAGSGQVKKLWRHKKQSSDRFFNETVFPAAASLLLLTGMETLLVTLIRRWPHRGIWTLTSHFSLSKGVRCHWSWLTPCLPVSYRRTRRLRRIPPASCGGHQAMPGVGQRSATYQ